MSPHSFYPKVDRITVTHLRAMPTVTPWYSGLLRFGRWLALFMCILLIIAGTVTTIAGLNLRQAQLDNAFMQGMAAGHQLCPRGI